MRCYFLNINNNKNFGVAMFDYTYINFSFATIDVEYAAVYKSSDYEIFI